jgi:hypothetical protein
MQPIRKTRSPRSNAVTGDIHEQLRQLYGPPDIPHSAQLRKLLARYQICLEGSGAAPPAARDDEEKQRNG